VAIEVVCPRCTARLQVPEEAAEAQAKCPHCHEVFDVNNAFPSTPANALPVTEYRRPESGANPYPETRDDPIPDSNNPYAAPLSAFEQEQLTGIGVQQAPLQLGRVDPGKTFQLAWELLKANLPILVLTHLAFFMISFAIQLPHEVAQRNEMQQVSAVIYMVGTAFQWFLTIGLMLITIRVARAQPVEFGLLFAGAPWFIRFAIANVLFAFMVLVGLIAFIVPGIYLALRFWTVGYFIVERDCSVMEAFSLAGQFSEGNKASFIVVFAITIGVGIAGALMFCVGLIFAYPLIMMMWTITYMMMTRQPIHQPGITETR
jgi:hypothetical protein